MSKEQDFDREEQPTMDPKTKFLMEALTSELGKMLDRRMEVVHDRLYQIEQSQTPSKEGNLRETNSNRGRGGRGARLGGRGCGGTG